ncbi:hypothetical protein RI844_01950 [Thalassotalea fonticola]|uniref:C2H2-type domain-containing protein n=1 Tax=Thalassotalea fonticola TaxID=3065649 RepID=A0ABZ0GQC4_9GAMM|nr:hypothetical protein RI844_01950 [Colwelliaceae bacterium S1-1]
MTDSNNIDDFKKYIWLDKTNGAIDISVEIVEWLGPHEPKLEYRIVKKLPLNTSDVQLEQELKNLISDNRYFARCAECKNACLRGRMHDHFICHTCAENNHDVVH